MIEIGKPKRFRGCMACGEVGSEIVIKITKPYDFHPLATRDFCLYSMRVCLCERCANILTEKLCS